MTNNHDEAMPDELRYPPGTVILVASESRCHS